MSESQEPPAAEPPVPLTRRQAREREQAASATEAKPVMPPAEEETRLLATVPADPQTELLAAAPASSYGSAFPSRTAERGGPPAPRGGVFGSIRKHPNAWLFSAVGTVFVLLAAGSVFAGMAVGSSAANAPAPAPTGSLVPARPVPAKIAAATPLRTCSIGALTSDPKLMPFQASVISATTGEVLLDRGGAKPSRTSSVLLTLTAAAALAVLGPDYQFSTKVYTGSIPGSVVLVGGGDPTLSALNAGQESVYRGAPKISDLASQAQDRSPVPITDIVLDSSLWDPSDRWDPSWDRSQQSDGTQPEITALTVDGGRASPAEQKSPRSSSSIADVGAAFASDLGISGAERITVGTVPAGAAVLGEVKSQPVRALVAYMISATDNTLGEYLARQISKVAGSDGSASSLARVIPAALSTYGLSTTGVVIRDGSGQSGTNAVPATFVAQLMAKIAAGQQNLNIIYDALPISGKTGTLASRFTGANAATRGAVNAMAGATATENSLAGVIHATDGATLSFAVYALGASGSGTIPALDTVIRGLFTCGNNLSNN
ncbi:MAG: D-alanyl-D-alanine carboxypeptidase [Actinomycetota bacterium]